MEYRAIWLTFFAVLTLMGAASALAPATVIVVLQRRQSQGAAWLVSALRILGAIVALVSVAEIVSIVAVSRLI
jgi:hypothetical protein